MKYQIYQNYPINTNIKGNNVGRNKREGELLFAMADSS